MPLPIGWWRHASHVRKVEEAKRLAAERDWRRSERRQVVWTWCLVVSSVLVSFAVFLIAVRFLLRHA